jgi:hypothetical protein
MYDATGVRLHAGRQAEVKLFVAVNIFCCVHVRLHDGRHSNCASGFETCTKRDVEPPQEHKPREPFL